jgi:hypothetical protein
MVPGIILLVASLLIPLAFLSFYLMPFGHLKDLSQGIDIFCCCGVGAIPMVAGLVLLVLGLAADGKKGPK